MLTQLQLIKKYGLKIRGQLGQHLLLDTNIAKKIVGLLDLKPSDTVLEIGPGLGSLTSHLLEAAIKRLVAVEKDARFVEVLKYEMPAKTSLEILEQDFLRFDFKQHFAARQSVKVVSNLPYYITAPILFRLIENRQYLERAVLMMQKEVAERLTAKPGTKAYGRLTLAVRYSCELEYQFNVPPPCFIPPPAVGSAVIQVRFRNQALLPPEEETRYFRLIQIAFGQRRKTLLSLLSGQMEPKKTKAEAAALLKKLNLPLDIRGERLSLEEFLTLTKAWIQS